MNRNKLIKNGVLYPAATGESGGSQWGFVGCVKEKPWGTDVGRALGIRSAADQASYKARFRDALNLEFEAAPGADVLIISSEHFHSRLTSTEGIARLKILLEPWVDNFEVVLYLRRQDRMAVSLFSTKIKSGTGNPVLFPGAPNQELIYYFNYEQIYAQWRAVFGKAAMQVRLYAKEEWEKGDLLLDFCQVAGIDSKGKNIPGIENEALNQEGSDFVLEVNRQLPNIVDGKRDAERDELVAFIAHLCRGSYYPASRDQAIKFYRRYAESNQRLKEKLFPERSVPLFDDDFSDYPEEVVARAPRYEDAVALAIQIWKARK